MLKQKNSEVGFLFLKKTPVFRNYSCDFSTFNYKYLIPKLKAFVKSVSALLATSGERSLGTRF